MGQTEEVETSQGKDIALGEQNPTKQPSSVRAEAINEIVVLPKKKKSEIKRFQKEQQKLHSLVKRLRQQIRILKRRKIASRTLKMVNAVIQTEFHDTRAMETQIEPMLIQNDKEQHATIIKVAAQTETAHFCNTIVQTKAIPSNSVDTQTDVQDKDVLISSDPIIINPQEKLAQAQLTIERLEEETIPQQRYQELERQLWNI